jgi:hypothetical protein
METIFLCCYQHKKYCCSQSTLRFFFIQAGLPEGHRSSEEKFFDLLENTQVLGADRLHRMVLEWADTWRSMNADKRMEYFSNVTSIYDIGKNQPLVFSKTRMEAIKEDILQ